MLADETMGHKPLIVKGSSAFRKSVLMAAAQANLNISFQDFQDKLLQRAFRQKKVEQDISLELIQSTQLTTKKILENMEEAKKQQSAVSHVEYINRKKAYEKRGGCIFQAHHLPQWAQDDLKKFFKAADRYEGVGHRRYAEIEFALPNNSDVGRARSYYVFRTNPARKKKDGSEPSFEERWKRGAPKDRK